MGGGGGGGEYIFGWKIVREGSEGGWSSLKNLLLSVNN